MKAIWKDTVIAQSDATEVVEGNHYFPMESITEGVLEKTEKTSTCPWKGLANYFNVKVGEEVNENGAWTYENPSEQAQNIKGYVAFWNGVEITE